MHAEQHSKITATAWVRLKAGDSYAWVNCRTPMFSCFINLANATANVNLSTNSSITFSPNFSQQPIREVWLKGEAFFSVKHTADHTKFRVHAEG